MKPVPEKIQKPYIDFLKQQQISSKELPYYLKWLRYYLDFCDKYGHPVSSHDSLPLYKNKLKQKNQKELQINQAQKAINLFYKLIQSYKNNGTKAATSMTISDQKVTYKPVGRQDISKNRSWKKELDMLNNEIRLRQYSRKTLRAYMKQTCNFQVYLKSKSPDLIDSKDAKAYITYLAVNKQVSASTQNLAFNALLFFFTTPLLPLY